LFNQWTPIDIEAKKHMYFEDQMIGLRTEKYKLLLNPSMDRVGYPEPENNYVLFDMQLDPLEQNNIISKYPKVAIKMKKKLKHKYTQLLNDKTNFIPPVFIIDPTNEVSVVNGFGPSSTGGNTTSKAHALTNLKSKGDFAYFNIKVKEPEEFDVYIKQGNTDGAGIVVSLAVNHQKISHELLEADIQLIGYLTLTPNDTKLVFNVEENNSYKPWAQISAFEQLFLVPKGKIIDLKNIKLH